MDKDEVAKILKPAFPGDLIEVDGENSYFTAVPYTHLTLPTNVAV